MDAYACIIGKREIRTFADRPVGIDVLGKILDAGRRSGSSRNRQPWHFVVVKERERLVALSRCGRFAQHIAGAAAAVVILTNEARDAFDAGRCAQNMMLAAWSFGVGSCPATLHRAEQARQILAMPAAVQVAIALSFGYPHPRGRGPLERTVMRVLTGRGRRPLESIVSWEQFGTAGKFTDKGAHHRD
ncbi:MAG TPA: nitroreductase family protein [bacterium]|jgi:nitroreductase